MNCADNLIVFVDCVAYAMGDVTYIVRYDTNVIFVVPIDVRKLTL